MISPNESTPPPTFAANFIWMVILALAGLGGSLVISCVTPFVALAVALAATVRLTLALRAMVAIWLANQFVGFAFFPFPRTPNTFLWGLAIGAAALLTIVIASAVLKHAPLRSTASRLSLAFALAYAVYEASLFVIALLLGGSETFSPSIIAQIGFVNAAWLAGLVALNELLSAMCKPWFGAMPRFVKVS